MHRSQFLFFLIPIAATLTAACDKDNATTDTTPTPSSSVAKVSVDAAAPLASASAMASASAAPSASASAQMAAERHAGIVGMFVRTARQLPLDEAKTAQLDKVLTPMTTGEDDGRAAMKAVHDDMVAGVKAGKIDKDKLQADYAVLDKSMGVRQDHEATALNELHKLLDATQRKALTAKLRDKQKERDAKMAEHKAQMNAQANAKTAGDGGAPDWTKKRLERMTRELDLDADQQKKIEPLIAKDTPKPSDMDARMADMKKRMDNLLTAFEKDDFDAKKNINDILSPKDMRAEMDKHVQFVQSVLPILKPEQRDKLAATMSKPMMHGPGGPGGPGGMGAPPGMGGPGAPGGPAGMGGPAGPGGDRPDWGHWGDIEQE